MAAFLTTELRRGVAARHDHPAGSEGQGLPWVVPQTPLAHATGSRGPTQSQGHMANTRGALYTPADDDACPCLSLDQDHPARGAPRGPHTGLRAAQKSSTTGRVSGRAGKGTEMKWGVKGMKEGGTREGKRGESDKKGKRGEGWEWRGGRMGGGEQGVPEKGTVGSGGGGMVH